MDFGNMPLDDGNLLLEQPTAAERLVEEPHMADLVRKIVGSKEVIHSLERYCLWIEDLQGRDGAGKP